MSPSDRKQTKSHNKTNSFNYIETDIKSKRCFSKADQMEFPNNLPYNPHQSNRREQRVDFFSVSAPTIHHS